MAKTSQNTVLIVGGVGFVGHHLVSHFLADPSCIRVFGLSRSVASSRFRVEGAKYVRGDLTDHSSISQILREIKPTVIIHAASPSPVTGTTKEYRLVNLHGTKNLLKCAKESEHVRAFLYTSSSALAYGGTHENLDEDCELANRDWRASAYARSKADAETMVLHANYPKPVEDKSQNNNWAGHLATASLRFPIIYGTGDYTAVPGCLGALAKGQTTTTLGDGTNLWSFCSVENMATSHLLLANALLNVSNRSPKERVDGEAFNINNGLPCPLWDFTRLCWKYAGYDPKPVSEMTHLPSWFALLLATVLEWMYWVFTLGTKRPYTLGKQQVEYACFTHTYSIEKAKKRLGYMPKGDFNNDLKKTVYWCLNEGGWNTKLKGTKGLKLN